MLFSLHKVPPPVQLGLYFLFFRWFLTPVRSKYLAAPFLRERGREEDNNNTLGTTEKYLNRARQFKPRFWSSVSNFIVVFDVIRTLNRGREHPEIGGNNGIKLLLVAPGKGTGEQFLEHPHLLSSSSISTGNICRMIPSLLSEMHKAPGQLVFCSVVESRCPRFCFLLALLGGLLQLFTFQMVYKFWDILGDCSRSCFAWKLIIFWTK